MAVLDFLHHWAPFRIDALGIVTILGAAEVDMVVGRMARHRFTGCLPLLGAFQIASNSIVRQLPSFILYNVTDGILATDVTGWFSRWLLSQNVTFSSTVLYISVKQKPTTRFNASSIGNHVVGMVLMSSLLAMAILTGDRWGLVNVLAMLVSVIVRQVIIDQNLAALDIAATKSAKTSNEVVKTFLVLPTGAAVTIKASRGIVVDCLLTTPRPLNPLLYDIARGAGWIAFGIHVVSLGMAAFLNQLLAVALLLVSTVLVTLRIGDDEYQIGSRLQIRRYDCVGPAFRAAALARLQLSTTQEDTMLAWGLFPQRSNEQWWRKYRACQGTPSLHSFRLWDKHLANTTFAAIPQGLEPPAVTTTNGAQPDEGGCQTRSEERQNIEHGGVSNAQCSSSSNSI